MIQSLVVLEHIDDHFVEHILVVLHMLGILVGHGIEVHRLLVFLGGIGSGQDDGALGIQPLVFVNHLQGVGIHHPEGGAAAVMSAPADDVQPIVVDDHRGFDGLASFGIQEGDDVLLVEAAIGVHFNPQDAAVGTGGGDVQTLILFIIIGGGGQLFPTLEAFRNQVGIDHLAGLPVEGGDVAIGVGEDNGVPHNGGAAPQIAAPVVVNRLGIGPDGGQLLRAVSGGVKAGELGRLALGTAVNACVNIAVVVQDGGFDLTAGNHRGFEGQAQVLLVKGIDPAAACIHAEDIDFSTSGRDLGQHLSASGELLRLGHYLAGFGVRLHQGTVGGCGVGLLRIRQVIVDVIPDDDGGRDVVKHDVPIVLRADPGLFEFLRRPRGLGIGYAFQLLVAQKLVPVQGGGGLSRSFPGLGGGTCQSAAGQKENRRQGGYRLSQGLCPTFH